MVALLDSYCNTPMAGTAENLARKHQISREEQDQSQAYHQGTETQKHFPEIAHRDTLGRG